MYMYVTGGPPTADLWRRFGVEGRVGYVIYCTLYNVIYWFCGCSFFLLNWMFHHDCLDTCCF